MFCPKKLRHGQVSRRPEIMAKSLCSQHLSAADRGPPPAAHATGRRGFDAFLASQPEKARIASELFEAKMRRFNTRAAKQERQSA
jgi:hypothetical protein